MSARDITLTLQSKDKLSQGDTPAVSELQIGNYALYIKTIELLWANIPNTTMLLEPNAFSIRFGGTTVVVETDWTSFNTGTELAAYLQARCAASANATVQATTFTYDSDTKRITIANTTPIQLVFTQIEGAKAARALGMYFNRQYPVSLATSTEEFVFPETAASSSFDGNRSINLAGDQVIYVAVKGEISRQSCTSKDIPAYDFVIPINAPIGGVITYSKEIQWRQTLEYDSDSTVRHIKMITIEMKDQWGRVSRRMQDWTLIFKIHMDTTRL